MDHSPYQACDLLYSATLISNTVGPRLDWRLGDKANYGDQEPPLEGIWDFRRRHHRSTFGAGDFWRELEISNLFSVFL